MTAAAPSLPTARAIQVDTRGAMILDEESPEIGGSLAKVIYFTRSANPPSSPSQIATRGSSPSNVFTPISTSPPRDSPISSPHPRHNGHNHDKGALTPAVLEHCNGQAPGSAFRDAVPPLASKATSASCLSSQSGGSAALLSPQSLNAHHLTDSLLRRASVQHFPGGSLNFERFETEHIDECVAFIRALIERSAAVNGVALEDMRRGVQIVATGGGAHRFHEALGRELLVEVRREDEMACLIEGLRFITLIPDEVYYFSDELIHSVSHPHQPLPQAAEPVPLERPSPNPPKYAVTFVQHPVPQLPCLLVNIGSGVSLVKVDEDGSFERVSGTSLGGGTLWGLLSLLTPATTFDEMLALSENGDNETVDMLVGDIYGSDYSKLGLKSTMIASTFGKVFKKQGGKKGMFKAEDISKSLLYAISNNIGQIAYVLVPAFCTRVVLFVRRAPARTSGRGC
uniref:Calcium dependent mitochondrial carrier protein n=1 Tax=Ganoderma boninense TaxID=34458 RepID=A0A5K1K0N8_9APHY|nr:Calcium dependent mitochondrial carrier protein [Ganoderma boninense]